MSSSTHLTCHPHIGHVIVFTSTMLSLSHQACHFLHFRHFIVIRSGISSSSHESCHCLYIWHVIILTSGMLLLHKRHVIFSTSGRSHLACYNHHIWHVSIITTGMSSLPHLTCHCCSVCPVMVITGIPKSSH